MTVLTIKVDLLGILDELTPQMASAFEAALADITSQASINRIARALDAGDIDLAVRHLGISADVFEEFASHLREAYVRAGRDFMKATPAVDEGVVGNRTVARFEMRNPRAERWIANKSSTLITGIVTEQREISRRVLSDAMRAGTGPRAAALDLVGRLDRRLGKRVGGKIGLSTMQERWSATAAAELSSGDPKQLKNYLSRKQRNKTFDRIVVKAIKEGKPVPKNLARGIINRYNSNLLRDRGETIARTEMLSSLHEAQDEATRQLIDRERITEDAVQRIWDAQEDGATRKDHAKAEGQTRGPAEPFVLGGHQLRYPGDRSLGAPASQTIRCRCRLITRIDFIKDFQERFGRG